MIVLMNDEIIIATDLNAYTAHDLAVDELGIKPYRLIENEIVIGLDILKGLDLSKLEYSGQKVYRAYEEIGQNKLDEMTEADLKYLIDHELRIIADEEAARNERIKNNSNRRALKEPTPEFKDYILNYLLGDN